VAATIDATPGGVSANSYCTVAEATSYNDAHISGAVWTAATDDAKIRALITATQLLDSHVTWTGAPTTTTQALAWPRIGMLEPNYALIDPINFATIPSTAIPSNLKKAVAEYGRLLLGNDPTAPSDTELAGISSLRAGSVELTFRSPSEASASASRAVVPSSVMAYIRTWTSTSAISKQLVRT
jgi:hypothetical protein